MTTSTTEFPDGGTSIPRVHLQRRPFVEQIMIDFPAQIVFIESDRGRSWSGRLLRPSACIDKATNARVTWTPFFNIKEGKDGRFYVTMQGHSAGGRRYTTFRALTEAQKAGIRWAARRFRVIS